MGRVFGLIVVEDGTLGFFPISKNVEGVVFFLNFLIFFNTGGDMKSDISLFGLRSNLFPKLSLVIAVGLRRALGLIDVLAVGFWVVVVATVVVVVVVDVVVVDVEVDVVVD